MRPLRKPQRKQGEKMLPPEKQKSKSIIDLTEADWRSEIADRYVHGMSGIILAISKLCGVSFNTAKNTGCLMFEGRSRFYQAVHVGLIWHSPDGHRIAVRNELESYFIMGKLPSAEDVTVRREINSEMHSEKYTGRFGQPTGNQRRPKG